MKQLPFPTRPRHQTMQRVNVAVSCFAGETDFVKRCGRHVRPA